MVEEFKTLFENLLIFLVFYQENINSTYFKYSKEIVSICRNYFTVKHFFYLANLMVKIDGKESENSSF